MKNRIKKINELIRRELGKILLKEIEFPKNVLVTLTRVETSSDLKKTKVFISVIPEAYSLRALKILNLRIYSLQHQINKRLKIKFIPKIIFLEEKAVREAAKIEEVLERIKRFEKK